MRLILCGISGQMGKVLQSLILDQGEHSIVGGISHSDGRSVYEQLAACPAADGIIDFSAPEATAEILRYAAEQQLPLLIATTGHSDAQTEQIHAAGTQIPLIATGNTSIGVYMMQELVARVSSVLADFDIEIIEKHHRYKKDAPSGTAKMLLEAAQVGRSGALPQFTRDPDTKRARSKDEIGVLALRGGTIVGEHEVFFCGEDEVLTIKHSALSKKIFASGALKAIAFLQGKPSGLYHMSDVIRGTHE